MIKKPSLTRTRFFIGAMVKRRLNTGIDRMPHLVAFRFKIETIVLVARRLKGNLFRDFQVETVVDERVDFFRVVRHKTDFVQTEILKNLNADAIVA